MLRKLTFFVLSTTIALFPSGAVALSHGKTLQNLGMNEIMFAQGMIPHHEQALTMSELALKKSKNQSILKLSNQIKAMQQAEVSQLTYWLTATKSSMTMDHEMHMAGMLTDKEFAALSQLSGDKFDKKFLNFMIKHHQGAIEMLALLKGSKNQEARSLAKSIKAGQSEEITKMKKLLNKLNKGDK